MPIKIQSGLACRQAGFATILIVILMVVLASLVLGGIYYYSEIYQPQNYARDTIALFDNLEKEIQVSQSQTLKDKKDYQGAIKVLQDQQAFLQENKDRLDSRNPPKKMSQFQQDFQKTLDLLIMATSDAQKVAKFIIKSNKLYDILKPKDEQRTVGEFIKFWEVRIEQAKIAASDLFQEKPPAKDLLQFDKLKSTWQETEEGYGIVLVFLRKQDPARSVSSVSEDDLSEAEKTKIKKIDEFLSMLEDVARADAESLIKFSTLEALVGDELNTLGPKVSNGIQELKQKYQK